MESFSLLPFLKSQSLTAIRMIPMLEIPESRKVWMLNQFGFNARMHSKNQSYQVWMHENHAIYLYGPNFIKEKIDYLIIIL